jgi:hypothetical protein
MRKLDAILSDPARLAARAKALKAARPSQRLDVFRQYRQLALRDMFAVIAESAPGAPLEFPNSLAREFVDIFDALSRGYSHPIVMPVAKRQGSRTWPALRRAQVAAVAYIKGAEAGLVSDRHPAKTTSEAFGVSRRLLRYWKKGSEAEVRALLAQHQDAPAVSLPKLLSSSASYYQRWRGGAHRGEDSAVQPPRRWIGSGRLARK